MLYETNEIVSKIGQITIEGNIIPNEWYVHLKNEKGKIQTNAALILADIIYWYRPVPVYHIQTGELIGHGKKFKEDLLQLGYKYFKNKFGLSEGQTRYALIFLEEKGLISREFRNIVIDHNALNNVMYINIYPEKISEITGKTHNLPTLVNKINSVEHASLQISEDQKTAISLPPLKSKVKDWSAKFTAEQKEFLSYLLDIKPEAGNPIEKDHATWWIKHFGIEKIKTALEVYWQRVEKAKQDHTVPMPQHIGKYIRKALNDGLLPMPSSITNEESLHQPSTPPPYSEKSNQGVRKIEPGPQKNQTTNTQISMTSMFLNEVNDKGQSVTFQKEEEQSIKINLTKAKNETSPNPLNSSEKNFRKANQQPDWKKTFTSEEKKFLSYLLRIQPEKGNPIEEKHATWWIKHFGIEKIKLALQVYWQQVEKSKQNSQVPMPVSIGAYVRKALNKETQPCREFEHKNKAFAEQFKKQVGWSTLTITQKYCRAEEMGKEWHYSLPEALFIESLKSTFENYCNYTERRCFVA